MEGFTPAFFLQLVIAIGSAGVMYGAVKADLKNMHQRIEDEKRLREQHSKMDDDIFHDIRDKVGEVAHRVSILEGRAQRD